MSLLKRLMILLTMLAYVCAATGCATNGRGVAANNHEHHGRSGVVEHNETEDSSGSSNTLKMVAIGVGAVALVVALGFAVVNLGAKGIGNNIGGSVA